MLKFIKKLFKMETVDDRNPLDRIMHSQDMREFENQLPKEPSREEYDKFDSDSGRVQWLYNNRDHLKTKGDNSYYLTTSDESITFFLHMDMKGYAVKVSNTQGWRVTLSSKYLQRWRGKFLAFHQSGDI